MTDNINSPSHYKCESATITIEPIELCEQCGFLLGNALKYLFRYQHKGKPLEDLKKAEFYLKRWLRHEEEDRGFTAELRCFNDEGLIFRAFADKEFFSRWDRLSVLPDNVQTVLDWTQQKIEELEA